MILSNFDAAARDRFKSLFLVIVLRSVNNKVPSLNHLRVWGCPAEAKAFNPNLGKLDLKTVSCHLIGYLERSKGYHFYCANKVC